MALRWPPWLYDDLRLLVAPMIKRGNTTPGVGTVGHRAAVRMRQIPYDASPSRAIRPRIRSADRQTTRTSRRRFRAATDLGRRLGRRRLGDRGRSPGARALAEPRKPDHERGSRDAAVDDPFALLVGVVVVPHRLQPRRSRRLGLR